jgi:hypothetical protein
MGAVLKDAFGGGVETLAPIPDSVGEGALGGVTDEEDLHTGGVAVESNAVPSGQVIVGGTSNISRVMRAHRTYATTNKSAAEQLTYL